ncbi:ribosome hibernation-promoting factor, HPF/YfiA family [Rhodospirillum centenum]|uniref:Ribosome hibernation promoting factor n=1 Tax=Rhodospirillum centenum (strain ATCC 51521 / SW) TaxID=414684 RepID=B6IW92_RHOCS|nr:ribosome-associated translation inhibitor RaiA [Rhodospirillum centenum]ACJ00566.1 ribosomal subunit interface protein, putative [Rhodospirillum centenum SW]
MQVTVKGKQLDVGDALRSHVTDTISALVAKYFGNPLDATVVISRDAHLFKADIQVHVGRGILLQSYGEATEPYPAFDDAAEKVAKRMRRYKRRMRDHHGRAAEEAPLLARKYILEAPPLDDGDADDQVDSLDAGTDAAQAGDEGHQPMIIAEMETSIQTLTVGEAVMRMDLTDIPALMFRNRAHGGLNMVYRRPDGNIGWVDPAGTGVQGA